VELFTAALKFTICSAYLPPHTAVTLADLQDALSQIHAPLLLLGDFNARNHLLGNIGEDESRRVIDTSIFRGNLVVLNMGKPTYISLSTRNLSCLDLAMYNPAISADFTCRLLDLCGSYHFTIYLNGQVSFTKSALQTGL
jgi:hypothetical protein